MFWGRETLAGTCPWSTGHLAVPILTFCTACLTSFSAASSAWCGECRQAPLATRVECRVDSHTPARWEGINSGGRVHVVCSYVEVFCLRPPWRRAEISGAYTYAVVHTQINIKAAHVTKYGWRWRSSIVVTHSMVVCSFRVLPDQPPVEGVQLGVQLPYHWHVAKQSSILCAYNVCLHSAS